MSILFPPTHKSFHQMEPFFPAPQAVRTFFQGKRRACPRDFPQFSGKRRGFSGFLPGIAPENFLDLPPRGTFILEIMEPWLPKTERTWDTDPEKGRDVSLSNHFVHPYMPNSVPAIEAEMLREVGVKDVAEIYRSVIPEDLLFPGEMDLPEPILSEQALKRHMNAILARNTSTEEAISFLGAGCYKRYIPAVCDEIIDIRIVPHRLLRGHLFRPRQDAGHLRVRQHDGRAAGAGRGELPHL